MKLEKYAVAVVLDPDAGENIRVLAERFDLWVMPSPANSNIVRQMSESGQAASGKLTIWSRSFLPTSESDWQGVIDTVELHHGQYSHNPPVSAIEVFGANLTPEAE